MTTPATPRPAHDSLGWWNGNYVPASTICLPLDDAAVMSGTMLTERLRTLGGTPWLVDEHLQRLRDGMRALGWSPRATWPELKEIIYRIADSGMEQLPPGHDLSLSVLVTAGLASQKFAKTTLTVTSSPLPLASYGKYWQAGVPLRVPTVRALPADVVPAALKHRSRLHWWIAREEVQRHDPLAMPLLLNAQNFVTETDTANLFIVRDGKLLTPRAEDTLPGVTQAKLIARCQKWNLTCERADITVDDLRTADEAFLTSSGCVLLPVTSIDSQPIGHRIDGPYACGTVTNRIVENWCTELGTDFRQQELGVRS